MTWIRGTCGWIFLTGNKCNGKQQAKDANKLFSYFQLLLIAYGLKLHMFEKWKKHLEQQATVVITHLFGI